MRLFSNRSQMTSKCGKNKKVAHEAQQSRSDKELTLETSAFLPFMVANLCFQPSC